MHDHPFTRAAGAVLLLALAAGPVTARKVDEPPPDSVCTILGTAARYVDTTVTVRGVATAAGKVTTLGDAGCDGRVRLSIDEGDVHKRDVSALRRAVGSNGAQANATVFGRFHATGDAQVPYAIDVYSARDVSTVE